MRHRTGRAVGFVLPDSNRPARLILLLGATAALLALAYALWNRWEGLVGTTEWKEALLYYVVPLVAIAAVLLGAAMHRHSDPIFILVIVGSVITALFAAETYLQYAEFDVRGRSMAAAERLQLPFDRRSKAQVVADLRREGKIADPFVRVTSRPDVLPLGLVSTSNVVTCNEFGPWFVVQTDRYGFSNPDQVWDRGTRLDVAIVGDSFALGQCDPVTGGFASLLRASGLRVLNLGIGGNDPLLNLASIVEYAVLRPARIIYWMHYAGNDLSGLQSNRNIPILQRYLNEATFRQGLETRREEIAGLLRSLEQEAYRAEDKESFTSYILTRETILRTFRLYSLRSAFGFARNIEQNTDFDLFGRVLERAQSSARAMNAVLIVVNIPAAGQVVAADSALERKTTSAVAAAGIRYIDLKPIFQREADPLALYAHGRGGGHLTPMGNQLVARVLFENAPSSERR
jgi:hypothetical protein